VPALAGATLLGGSLRASAGCWQHTTHLPDGAVEPEQWLQRHPEAGSSWPSWPKASHSLGDTSRSLGGPYNLGHLPLTCRRQPSQHLSFSHMAAPHSLADANSLTWILNVSLSHVAACEGPYLPRRARPGPGPHTAPHSLGDANIGRPQHPVCDHVSCHRKVDVRLPGTGNSNTVCDHVSCEEGSYSRLIDGCITQL